jgi:hypothetical protein
MEVNKEEEIDQCQFNHGTRKRKHRAERHFGIVPDKSASGILYLKERAFSLLR